MKIAIISGASSGIGRCFAKHLDSFELDELWLIGRSQDKLNNLQKSINSKCRIFALDLTQPSAYETLSEALNSDSYYVEYLILSAGVGYTGAFAENTVEQIQAMIDTNCYALTCLSKITLPYIIKNGKIITVASGAGFLPQADFAVYAATKSFVISFSRALRQELMHKRISVTAVCPGPVDTDFFNGLSNVKNYKKKYLISTDKVVRSALKAALKNKAICTPTFSMKIVHLFSKILPTSLLLKFNK